MKRIDGIRIVQVDGLTRGYAANGSGPVPSGGTGAWPSRRSQQLSPTARSRRSSMVCSRSSAWQAEISKGSRRPCYLRRLHPRRLPRTNSHCRSKLPSETGIAPCGDLRHQRQILRPSYPQQRHPARHRLHGERKGVPIGWGSGNRSATRISSRVITTITPDTAAGRTARSGSICCHR